MYDLRGSLSCRTLSIPISKVSLRGNENRRGGKRYPFPLTMRAASVLLRTVKQIIMKLPEIVPLHPVRAKERMKHITPAAG